MASHKAYFPFVSSPVARKRYTSPTTALVRPSAGFRKIGGVIMFVPVLLILVSRQCRRLAACVGSRHFTRHYRLELPDQPLRWTVHTPSTSLPAAPGRPADDPCQPRPATPPAIGCSGSVLRSRRKEPRRRPGCAKSPYRVSPYWQFPNASRP